MSIPNIGILGDGIVERNISEYYHGENLATCSLLQRQSGHDWERLFSVHDGMILDFRDKPAPERQLDSTILNKMREWQRRVVVVGEDSQNCWSELAAIGVEPLMVIQRPPRGSIKSNPYCIQLLRAVNMIADEKQRQEQPAGQKSPMESNGGRAGIGQRSVAPLLQVTGALLVVGGVFGVLSTLKSLSFEDDIVKQIGPQFVAMISTGIAMLGGPGIRKHMSKKEMS